MSDNEIDLTVDDDGPPSAAAAAPAAHAPPPAAVQPPSHSVEARRAELKRSIVDSPERVPAAAAAAYAPPPPLQSRSYETIDDDTPLLRPLPNVTAAPVAAVSPLPLTPDSDPSIAASAASVGPAAPSSRKKRENPDAGGAKPKTGAKKQKIGHAAAAAAVAPATDSASPPRELSLQEQLEEMKRKFEEEKQKAEELRVKLAEATRVNEFVADVVAAQEKAPKSTGQTTFALSEQAKKQNRVLRGEDTSSKEDDVIVYIFNAVLSDVSGDLCAGQIRGALALGGPAFQKRIRQAVNREILKVLGDQILSYIRLGDDDMRGELLPWSLNRIHLLREHGFALYAGDARSFITVAAISTFCSVFTQEETGELIDAMLGDNDAVPGSGWDHKKPRKGAASAAAAAAAAAASSLSSAPVDPVAPSNKPNDALVDTLCENRFHGVVAYLIFHGRLSPANDMKYFQYRLAHALFTGSPDMMTPIKAEMDKLHGEVVNGGEATNHVRRYAKMHGIDITNTQALKNLFNVQHMLNDEDEEIPLIEDDVNRPGTMPIIHTAVQVLNGDQLGCLKLLKKWGAQFNRYNRLHHFSILHQLFTPNWLLTDNEMLPMDGVIQRQVMTYLLQNTDARRVLNLRMTDGTEEGLPSNLDYLDQVDDENFAFSVNAVPSNGDSSSDSDETESENGGSQSSEDSLLVKPQEHAAVPRRVLNDLAEEGKIDDEFVTHEAPSPLFPKFSLSKKSAVPVVTGTTPLDQYKQKQAAAAEKERKSMRAMLRRAGAKDYLSDSDDDDNEEFEIDEAGDDAEDAMSEVTGDSDHEESMYEGPEYVPGRTVLMLAAADARLDTVKFLIKTHPNIQLSTRDVDGRNFIDLLWRKVHDHEYVSMNKTATVDVLRRRPDVDCLDLIEFVTEMANWDHQFRSGLQRIVPTRLFDLKNKNNLPWATDQKGKVTCPSCAVFFGTLIECEDFADLGTARKPIDFTKLSNRALKRESERLKIVGEAEKKARTAALKLLHGPSYQEVKVKIEPGLDTGSAHTTTAAASVLAPPLPPTPRVHAPHSSSSSSASAAKPSAKPPPHAASAVATAPARPPVKSQPVASAAAASAAAKPHVKQPAVTTPAKPLAPQSVKPRAAAAAGVPTLAGKPARPPAATAPREVYAASAMRPTVTRDNAAYYADPFVPFSTANPFARSVPAPPSLQFSPAAFSPRLVPTSAAAAAAAASLPVSFAQPSARRAVDSTPATDLRQDDAMDVGGLLDFLMDSLHLNSTHHSPAPARAPVYRGLKINLR